MLISIIIPVYNSETYLDNCIHSCLNQSYRDIELILVDDGSTDGSFAKCEKFREQDDRVIVVHQDNAGASAARNKGLDLANGEYVMFVDSDDWIDHEMIEEMIGVVLYHPEIQIVQIVEPGEMTQQERDGFYNSEEAVRSLLEGSWWGSVCKLIKSDLITNVRFHTKTISEDYLFNYHLFSNLDTLYYLKRSFYHWTIRPDSLSKSKLSARKFDEFYNVKAVSDLAAIECPKNQQLADVHLAGTCLKLLFLIFQENAEDRYSSELKDLLDCIKKKYRSFLLNRNIPRNERILLSTCFSRLSAKLAERIYHIIK